MGRRVRRKKQAGPNPAPPGVAYDRPRAVKSSQGRPPEDKPGFSAFPTVSDQYPAQSLLGHYKHIGKRFDVFRPYRMPFIAVNDGGDPYNCFKIRGLLVGHGVLGNLLERVTGHVIHIHPEKLVDGSLVDAVVVCTFYND